MQSRSPATPVAWLDLDLVTAGAAPIPLPALEHVYVNPSPATVADFTLTDHMGKPRAFSSLRGKPTLVFFGFTHCPDVCPQTLARLKALHHAQDGALKSAQVVLISVDGDRDTPALLKAYLAPLSADFIGLTGDPKSTAKIAAQFAAVFFKEPPGKDGNYNVMHTSQIFVVDKAGRLRASFVNASLEDMATTTSLLIKEAG
jgi:protein SCO1/2